MISRVSASIGADAEYEMSSADTVKRALVASTPSKPTVALRVIPPSVWARRRAMFSTGAEAV